VITRSGLRALIVFMVRKEMVGGGAFNTDCRIGN
jgi:hypothetical protein